MRFCSRMMNQRLTHSLATACAMLCMHLCLGQSFGQAAPLITITPTVETPRTHAPLQFDANVRWDFPTVLEGTLKLEFYVAQKKVHTWISRELALSNSEISLPVMAPAIILNDSSESLDIKATFVSEKKNYSPEDELNMLYWNDWKRVMVVGVVHPVLNTLSSVGFKKNEDDVSDEMEWGRHFRLDHTLPHPKLSNHFVTRSTRIDPRTIPTSALELVAFDMLVLTRDGLHALSSEQLDAITGWVEAGGAICVFGEHANTAPVQKFIKQMVVSNAVDPKVRFETAGTTKPLLNGTPEWHLSSPGIGRALVNFKPVDRDNPEWKAAVLQLWRMRNDQLQRVLTTGEWSYPEPKTGYPNSADFGKSLENFLYHPMSPQAGDDEYLSKRLLPDRIEGVPFWSVATLLLCCLLAIGPGDYFLLGFLQKRRWTWLFFPVVAMGFAMYTIQLAQSHMGATDHIQSLSIVDLSQDGRITRVSKFELLFPAVEKIISSERTREFYVPIEHRFLIDEMIKGTPPEDPMTYEGRAPISYKILRNVHQWKPQLSRSTVFGPGTFGSGEEIVLPAFDWEPLTYEALKEEATRPKLLRQLTDSFGDHEFVLLHQGVVIERTPVDAIATEDSESSSPPAESLETSTAGELEKFLTSMSSHALSGPFQVVAQLAPNLAGNLEDLSLHDSSDPEQLLLLLIQSDDHGNYTVYRRLIRKSDT